MSRSSAGVGNRIGWVLQWRDTILTVREHPDHQHQQYHHSHGSGSSLLFIYPAPIWPRHIIVVPCQNGQRITPHDQQQHTEWVCPQFFGVFAVSVDNISSAVGCKEGWMSGVSPAPSPAPSPPSSLSSRTISPVWPGTARRLAATQAPALCVDLLLGSPDRDVLLRSAEEEF